MEAVIILPKISEKICVPSKTENVNLNAFSLMAGRNE